MSDDLNKHMADTFPGLVSVAQESAVAQADEAHQADRLWLQEQRAEQERMNSSDLLQQYSEFQDPEDHQKKVNEELDKIQAEAEDATTHKEEEDHEGLPTDHFPLPVITVGK